MEQKNIIAAFDAAKGDNRMTAVLTALFGEQKPEIDNRPITERIKTFEDARAELSCRAENGDTDAGDLLSDYESNADNITVRETVAHMQLIIIVAALNEGWKPQFIKNERRWAPYFCLYTPEEMAKMSDEDRVSCRVVGRSSVSAHAYGGVACADASNASSLSITYYGSRLAFKTPELAEYAGKQFIDIYCAEMGIELKEKED